MKGASPYSEPDAFQAKQSYHTPVAQWKGSGLQNRGPGFDSPRACQTVAWRKGRRAALRTPRASPVRVRIPPPRPRRRIRWRSTNAGPRSPLTSRRAGHQDRCGLAGQARGRPGGGHGGDGGRRRLRRIQRDHRTQRTVHGFDREEVLRPERRPIGTLGKDRNLESSPARGFFHIGPSPWAAFSMPGKGAETEAPERRRTGGFDG